MDDIYYMNLAIEEAKKAQALGEVPVGAVIIDSNENIIGYGFNNPISTNDPTGHAEINALRMAARALDNYRLVGTTLYATIEPCIMCMGAIVHARIKRLVYGARDLKWGAVESLYKMAQDSRLNHHPEITAGICEEKTKMLIKKFFINKRST